MREAASFLAQVPGAIKPPFPGSGDGVAVCAKRAFPFPKAGPFASLRCPMFAQVYSGAVYGVDAFEVEIEVNAAGGNPVIAHSMIAYEEERELPYGWHSARCLDGADGIHSSRGGLNRCNHSTGLYELEPAPPRHAAASSRHRRLTRSRRRLLGQQNPPRCHTPESVIRGAERRLDGPQEGFSCVLRPTTTRKLWSRKNFSAHRPSGAPQPVRAVRCRGRTVEGPRPRFSEDERHQHQRSQRTRPSRQGTECLRQCPWFSAAGAWPGEESHCPVGAEQLPNQKSPQELLLLP